MSPKKAKQVLSKPPSLAEDAHKDELFKTKLWLEASLEAMLDQPLLSVPSGGVLLRKHGERDACQLERTLEYYTQMNSEMDDRLRALDKSIARGEQIRDELLKCQEASSPQALKITLMKRSKEYKRLFAGFKSVFEEVLNDADEELPTLNISTILQTLCDRMMAEPGDPYLDVDDLECSKKALQFLVNCGLVQRNASDSKKIKLLDPRT